MVPKSWPEFPTAYVVVFLCACLKGLNDRSKMGVRFVDVGGIVEPSLF
jgi:hypothetical protein